MLTAYFDDSGTHAGSEIVVVAGLLGTESQWLAFEPAWQAILDAPVENRPPLQRFHMSECEAGDGEYFGWSQGERDHLIYRFRRVILESDLGGYGMAIARADWDRLIIGKLRDYLGDAERHCVSNCILHAMGWAAAVENEKEVAFVFDDRKGENAATERIFQVYHQSSSSPGIEAKPLSITFSNSYDFLPLQGADMVAWETYNYAKNILKLGLGVPPREHFKRFWESGRFDGQIARPEDIEGIATATKEQMRLGGFL